MLRWDTYFRVIKQTPEFGAVYPYEKDDRRYYEHEKENMDDTCLIIEMGTGVENSRIDVHRRWDVKSWGLGGDTSLWLFSQGKLIACKFRHQDWYARDYNCGNPECGREWGGSVHSRNVNAFCSNDDGFNITMLELSYMYATELQRVSTAYLDAVTKDTGQDTMKVIIHHDTKVGYNKSDDDNNGGCK